MSDIPNPYAGQGGSYLLDENTGEVTLIQRTQLEAPPEPAQPKNEIPEPA
ncbi:MAG: hypothetical protein JWM78_1668 [Verrucomicrobiaceae bacterium]|nr:hypothetical protein [Verrucomicrobiaceae bacterium]